MSARSERAFKRLNISKNVSHETCGHNKLCPYKGGVLMVFDKTNFNDVKDLNNPIIPGLFD